MFAFFAPLWSIDTSIIKTDENDLFVELDNNKQVEYRVKSPKFVLHVLEYYYLNIEILKFYENVRYLASV
jgi:hypothetical protein